MQKKVIDLNKDLREDKKLDFQAGDIVRVYLKIREGEKERLQMFEGLVIAIKGRQSSSPTLTVRKVSNGVGVEMIVPILSKNIDRIELIKKAKVRRAKLYYVRELTAKQSRMKYKNVSNGTKAEGKKEAIAEETVVETAPSNEEAPKEETVTEEK